MFDPTASFFWAGRREVWQDPWGYSPRLIAAGNVDDLSDPLRNNLDFVVVGNGYDWNSGYPTDWAGVLLGDGHGSFSQSWLETGCDEPRGLALGDFTGDGHADIAFGDPWGYVHLMAGDGYGNFAWPTAFSVGDGIASLVAGDFTGDGVQDLAIGHDSGSDVTVLTIDTPGGFESSITFDIGISDSHSLAAADFDDDGDLDLAVTSYGSHSVRIVRNGEDIDLLDAYDSGGEGPAYVTSGDFNDDEIPDLAIANNASSTVGVLLGNGDGTFQPVRTSDAVANGASARISSRRPISTGTGSSIWPWRAGGGPRVLPGNGDGAFRRPSFSPTADSRQWQRGTSTTMARPIWPV